MSKMKKQRLSGRRALNLVIKALNGYVAVLVAEEFLHAHKDVKAAYARGRKDERERWRKLFQAARKRAEIRVLGPKRVTRSRG